LQSELAPPSRIAIGAIVKNEAPYILEWVAYHRVLGVERFFIADNASDDGTTELLAGLQAIGVVDSFAFPGARGRPPQLPAYSQIMSRYRYEADWVAFIDADEFIVPAGNLRTLRQYFAAVGPNVGAVVLNWALYGSSRRREPSDGLVIERFFSRAEENHRTNFHYKTIVRSEDWRGVGTNPHAFHTRDGAWTVQADGFEVANHPDKGPGISDRLVWAPLRINHYVVKSRAEFDRKKAPRGRATIQNAFRDDKFFQAHDRNEVADPMPDWLIAATKEEIAAIKQRLALAGLPQVVIDLDKAVSSLRPIPSGQEDK